MAYGRLELLLYCVLPWALDAASVPPGKSPVHIAAEAVSTPGPVWTDIIIIIIISKSTVDSTLKLTI